MSCIIRVTPSSTSIDSIAVGPAVLSSRRPSVPASVRKRIQQPLVLPTSLPPALLPPSPQERQQIDAFIEQCFSSQFPSLSETASRPLNNDFPFKAGDTGSEIFLEDQHLIREDLFQRECIQILCSKHTALITNYDRLLKTCKELMATHSKFEKEEAAFPSPEKPDPKVTALSEELQAQVEILAKMKYAIQPPLVKEDPPKNSDLQPLIDCIDRQISLLLDKTSRIQFFNDQLKLDIDLTYCSILEKQNKDYPIRCELNRKKLQIQQLALQTIRKRRAQNLPR